MGSDHLTLWGGRFENGPAPELLRINHSLSVDWRLWPHEIEVDQAWVEALHAAGHLTAGEARDLQVGLRAVADRLATGSPQNEPDEDVHTLIERWLTAEVGDLASQLRLGRSRNDVVATDTRMWTREALKRTDLEVRAVQKALIEAAEAAIDIHFPAYSHLQRAQPTRAAVWLLSHFWPLQRSRDRVWDAHDRANQMPLGSGAGMGSSVPVDRGMLAESLGFAVVLENSLDAVQSRDWVSEALFVWAQMAVDLSRLAEDLIVYSTREFGLIKLGERFTTGSSLMPQKRNPDGAELTRAAGAKLIGLLTGVMSALKGLPSGYNKDLQEDKTALFEAEGRVSQCLQVIRGTVETLEFDVERCHECLDTSTLATDVADYLVETGLRFSDAHRLTGELVRYSEDKGVDLSEVSSDERRSIHPALEELPPGLWNVDLALERRSTRAGSSRDAVEEQISVARRATAGEPSQTGIPGVA
ncbi:MAG: argininosuccinate lyase [Gemmatimonadota bacterium]